MGQTKLRQNAEAETSSIEWIVLAIGLVLVGILLVEIAGALTTLVR